MGTINNMKRIFNRFGLCVITILLIFFIFACGSSNDLAISVIEENPDSYKDSIILTQEDSEVYEDNDFLAQEDLAIVENDNFSLPDFLDITIAYDEHDFSDNRFADFDGLDESNPNKLMAHNIYSDPLLPSYAKGYNGFIIDFKADDVAEGTYWALCNWSMDTSCLNEKYNNVKGGGAYCGLQARGDGKKAIMSFWEIECDDEIITPTLVYPVKEGNTYFSNEGSGANYITDYDWKDGKWYRLFIECYEDPETNHTFVDMWVLELETNKYTRICCYNTKLTNSYFVGAMSQFMENYDYNTATKVRSFQYANIRVRDADNNAWINIDKSKLSIDTWWGNKKGDYEFGSTKTNLWGITCGYGEDVAPINSDISSLESIQTIEN